MYNYRNNLFRHIQHLRVNNLLVRHTMGRHRISKLNQKLLINIINVLLQHIRLYFHLKEHILLQQVYIQMLQHLCNLYKYYLMCNLDKWLCCKYMML